MNRKDRRIVGSIVLGALWGLFLGPVGMVVGLGAYAITGESRSSRKSSFSEDRDLIELLQRGREIERARRQYEGMLTRLDEHLKAISKPKIDLQHIKVEPVSSFDKLIKPYEPLLEEIRRIEKITSSLKPSISTGSYIERKSESSSPTIEEAIQRIIQAED